MTVVLHPGGPRSVQLIEQAYAEEGLPCPPIDERTEATRLLYPRSYVEAVDAMPGAKRYDYCFIGGLYRTETYPNRSWILDFARERFTDRSFFLVTDDPSGHEPLGSYDRSGIDRDVFVPKLTPIAERARFHPHYFEVLRASVFTLCPAGDMPWSMRFFETIMCRSLPIVSDIEHVGRNHLERAIGYHAYLADDEHVYDSDVAEDNRRRFVLHQTLLGRAHDG